MDSRRRIICAATAAALLMLPVTGIAQPQRVRHLGLFHVGLDHDPPGLAPLREALKKLGYEDGKNIRLDYRNQPDENAAREVARTFARERVDIILAFENQAVRAAQAATKETPIVFAHVSDPVAAGFVKSMASPGGNLTGVADFIGQLNDKRVQIFTEIVKLRRLLMISDPTDPATPALRAEMIRAAPQLKVELVEREATTQADVIKVFGSLKKGEVDGVTIISPKLNTNFPSLVLRLSFEQKLPLTTHRRPLAEEGALFSYGPNHVAVGEDIARYVDRILKGAKPSDLPVQQVARLELVINLKTARALGITVSESLRARADHLIE